MNEVVRQVAKQQQRTQLNGKQLNEKWEVSTRTIWNVNHIKMGRTTLEFNEITRTCKWVNFGIGTELIWAEIMSYTTRPKRVHRVTAKGWNRFLTGDETLRKSTVHSGSSTPFFWWQRRIELLQWWNVSVRAFAPGVFKRSRLRVG